MSRLPLNVENIDKAARVLARAVESYNASRPTGKGRRTVLGFAPVVARALGRKRLEKSVFASVVNRSIEMRLVEKVESESGRIYLKKGPGPVDEQAEIPADQEQKEQATPAKAPPVTSGKGPAPSEPPPHPLSCGACGYKAETCWHCSVPVDDSDVYVDGTGSWRCGSCNDLTFKDSWGGYRRWHLSLSTEE